IKTLVSTAVRTRGVVLRVPGLPSQLVDLGIHVGEFSFENPNDRIQRGAGRHGLARQQNPLAGLELEDLAGPQAELLSQGLGNRDLAFFRDGAFHTNIVGIPTNLVKRREPGRAARVTPAESWTWRALRESRRIDELPPCPLRSGERSLVAA